MSDLLTTLAERLRWVSLPWGQGTIALTDEGYDALAREALAVVAEALPTREEIAEIVGWGYASDGSPCAEAVLRDLRKRLGGK